MSSFRIFIWFMFTVFICMVRFPIFYFWKHIYCTLLMAIIIATLKTLTISFYMWVIFELFTVDFLSFFWECILFSCFFVFWIILTSILDIIHFPSILICFCKQLFWLNLNWKLCLLNGDCVLSSSCLLLPRLWFCSMNVWFRNHLKDVGRYILEFLFGLFLFQGSPTIFNS